MTDVNIIPTDNSAILIKLLEGQSAGQTEMRIQNQRLFGGDGQEGVLRYITRQHEELGKQIIEGFKEINATITKGAKEQDDRITAVENKQYYLTGAGTIIGALGGWLGSLFRHS